MPEIPVIKRLRQEDLKFQVQLGYIIDTFLKIKQPHLPKPDNR